MNYDMLRETIGARRKSFAFLAFLASLSLVLFLYQSLWQQPALEKARRDWTAKRDALASGQTQGTAQRYQNGVRDLALFQKRLIPKKDFAAFLSELYDSAGSNSLALKSIQYKPSVVKGQEGRLMSYGISFSVKGKYASVKSFLADMARWHQMVTLDSVALANSSNTEEAVELRVQLTAYLKMEGA